MISACIITKNEKENIVKCVRALESVGFGKSPYEIVVADTGSTDGTREILLDLEKEISTLKVYDFKWQDDFSKAKNYVISKASNDFVLTVDSDEYMDEKVDIQKLAKLVKSSPQKVGRIKRRNIVSYNDEKKENHEWINRIFSKNYFEYEGCIHEQVVSKDRKHYETYLTEVSFLHTGFDLTNEQKEIKAKRNIVLLEKEYERIMSEIDCDDITKLDGIKPETGSAMEQLPYILYQLGKSYYMKKDYLLAAWYFEKGLIFDLNPRLEYVIDMVETYGYSLINSKQADKALFFEGIYDEFGHSADFKFLMGLIYMNNGMFDRAIEEFLKATKTKEYRSVGTNSFDAYHNIAVIYDVLGNKADAKKYYKLSEEAKMNQ